MQHGETLFGNGARPNGLLEVQGTLSEEQLQVLRQAWESAYSGENSNRVAVLEAGMTFKPLTMSSDDAQFLETRKYQRSEIASIFRVPLHKINDLERSTFSNIEHQSLEFVTDTLMPHARRIEQALKRDVLPDGNNLYAEFLFDSLLRGDVQARYEAYAIAINNGIMSPNEVRAKENMNPRAGGDEYLRPLNMESSNNDAQQD